MGAHRFLATCLACIAGAGAAPAVPSGADESTPELVSLQQVSAPGAGSCVGGADSPQLAIDPTNSRHRVITYLTGDGKAANAATTTDGGQSWHQTQLPGVTTCTGGPDGTGNDPYLALFGNKSIATNSWVATDGSTAVDHDAVRDLVSISADGGQTYGVASDLEPTQPDQRAPVLIEANAPDHVLVEVERAHWFGPAAYDYLPDQVVVLRSTDGGHTFAAPVALGSAVPPQLSLSGGIVQSGTTIVALYTNITYDEVPTAVTGGTLKETVQMVRSTDDGLTFSPPVSLGDLGEPAQPFGSPAPPLNGTGCCIPSLSSAADGSLAAVWGDASTGLVTLARSSDAGATWSTTQLHPVHGATQPVVTSLPGGDAAVFYYDRWPDADGKSIVQPTVTLVRGNSTSTMTLSDPFDLVAITDGTSDAGPIGPFQSIGYEPEGHFLDIAFSRPTVPSDVQVFEARVHL